MTSTRITRRLPHLALLAVGAAWLVLLVAGSFSGAQSITRYLPGVDTSLPGSALYAAHCLACHGPTGQGLDESRARFPADHQQCTRCHNPRNPPTLHEHYAPNDLAVFSLGQPTALADSAYLTKFPTLAALETYVQAAMPRWDPGKLTPSEAREVSLYTLHLSGSVPPGVLEAFMAGDADFSALDSLSVPLGH
ncbi:MAG: c-type cytochrome [Trueperaceae bacterium]